MRALEAGADDYVTKPFSPRRAGRAAEGRAAPGRRRPPRSRSIAADGLEVDLAGARGRRDGEEIHLTPNEFDLLRALARNRGRLLTHRALLQRGLGPRPTPTTCRRCAPTSPTCAARSSPTTGGPRYIRTDPGVGYRFAA